MTSCCGDDGDLPLGEEFGAGLTALEINWLIDREWAMSADDILWRRTKLGLAMTVEQVAAVEAYVEQGLGSRQAAKPPREHDGY
jgi:glycerol-3-phosphate dehydrogenase